MLLFCTEFITFANSLYIRCTEEDFSQSNLHKVDIFYNLAYKRRPYKGAGVQSIVKDMCKPTLLCFSKNKGVLK